MMAQACEMDAGSDEAQSRPSPVAAAALPAAAWRAERMVRFSDCDPAGIVYTPRWIDMLNGVIEDLFPAALGLDYHGIIAGGVGLGYASIHCDFFRPARMGDAVAVTPVVARVGGASTRFTLHVHRGETELLRGHFVMVTTARDHDRAIPLPSPLREALIRYQEICR